MNASSSTGSKWRPRCSRIICTASSHREGLAVDTIARERVEDVGDRHDAPLDRDRLAGQPAWVAGAVPLLLVAQRDRRRELEDRRGRSAQQPVALLGVRLDDRTLLGRQRPGLEQDRVGDRHLADVVQRRRVAELLAELRVHADLFGQQRREAADALDVRARVLVAELDRHRQSSHRLGLRDLELRQRAAQLVGATVDLLLERRPAALAEAPAERDRRRCEHRDADDLDRRAGRHDRADERGQRDDRQAEPTASPDLHALRLGRNPCACAATWEVAPHRSSLPRRSPEPAGPAAVRRPRAIGRRTARRRGASESSRVERAVESWLG